MSIQITTKTLRLPKALFDFWKPKKKALKKIIEAAVLELVRERKITSGKAAELLDMSRWEFIELMSKYNIPMADFTSEELEKQMKDFKKLRK